MRDRPDDPEGAPAPSPRRGRDARRRRKRYRHRIPWAGLREEPLGVYPFPSSPPDRALFAEGPGCRFLLGVDAAGRLVGVAVFPLPATLGGEAPEPDRYGWTHQPPPFAVGAGGASAGPSG